MGYAGTPAFPKGDEHQQFQQPYRPRIPIETDNKLHYKAHESERCKYVAISGG